MTVCLLLKRGGGNKKFPYAYILCGYLVIPAVYKRSGNPEISARVGIRHPWSEMCWGASSGQGACVICPYAPSLHNRLMPKQSSSNVFSSPSSRPAICKQSETVLFSHTLQVQVLAWSISSPFRHEMPPQSWKSSWKYENPALRKSGWKSVTELFNDISALRRKIRQ